MSLYIKRAAAHQNLVKLASGVAAVKRIRQYHMQKQAADPTFMDKAKGFMRDNPGYSAAIGAGIAGLLGTMTNGVSGGLVGAGLGGLAGWGGSNYLQQSTTGDTKPPELEGVDPDAPVGPDLSYLLDGQGLRDHTDVPNWPDLSDISSVANHLSPSGTITVAPTDFTYLGTPKPSFTVSQEQPLGVTPAFAPGSVAMAGEGPSPYPNWVQAPTVFNNPLVNSPASIQVPNTINDYHTN